MNFDKEQNDALGAPLNSALIKQRKQGGGMVDYVDGHSVISAANRIFGFGGWNRYTESMVCVQEIEESSDKGPRWRVAYLGRVRVIVGDVVRDGTGFGNGLDKDRGAAHESAAKECETDAYKRAMMTFGNAFGLALYDKDRKEVETRPVGAPAGFPDRKACFAILTAMGVPYDDHKAVILPWLSAGQAVLFDSSTEVPAEVWTAKRAALTAWQAGQKKISVFDSIREKQGV